MCSVISGYHSGYMSQGPQVYRISGRLGRAQREGWRFQAKQSANTFAHRSKEILALTKLIDFWHLFFLLSVQCISTILTEYVLLSPQCQLWFVPFALGCWQWNIKGRARRKLNQLKTPLSFISGCASTIFSEYICCVCNVNDVYSHQEAAFCSVLLTVEHKRKRWQKINQLYTPLKGSSTKKFSIA